MFVVIAQLILQNHTQPFYLYHNITQTIYNAFYAVKIILKILLKYFNFNLLKKLIFYISIRIHNELTLKSSSIILPTIFIQNNKIFISLVHLKTEKAVL